MVHHWCCSLAVDRGIVACARQRKGLRPSIARRAPSWEVSGVRSQTSRSAGHVLNRFRHRRFSMLLRKSGSSSGKRVELQLELIVKRRLAGKDHGTRSDRARGIEPATKAGRYDVRVQLGVHEAHVAAGTPIRRNSQDEMESFFKSALCIGLPDRAALAAWTFMEPRFIPAVPEGQTHQLHAS